MEDKECEQAFTLTSSTLKPFPSWSGLQYG